MLWIARLRFIKHWVPDCLSLLISTVYSYELKKRGWDAETEVKLPLLYEDQKIDVGYKIDTLINKLVVVENKSVETLLPVHERNC